MALAMENEATDAFLDPRKSSLVLLCLYLVDGLLLASLATAGAGTLRSALSFVATGIVVAVGSMLFVHRTNFARAQQPDVVVWQSIPALFVTFAVGVTDPAFTILMLMTTLVIVPTSALRVPARSLALLWGLAAVSNLVAVAAQDEVVLPTDSPAQRALTLVFLLWTLTKGASIHLAGVHLRADLEDSHHRLASALERLEALAERDELTGLANRRRVMTALAEERDRADRTGNGFRVAMLDIDHFKGINDQYGHPQGDAVLRIIATLMQGALRRHDMVGRIGGEEFLIVLPGAAGVSEAHQAAERVRSAIEDYDWSHVAEQLAVTVSIGVAVSERLEPVENLIERADRGLYRAKKDGRNRSQLEPVSRR